MFINSYKKAFSVILNKPFVLWGLSLMSVLITFVASLAFISIPVLGIAIGYLITAGMAKVYLDGLKGMEVRSEQLFFGFSKNAGRIAGALAWKDLWILIWALVPIAGPIIAIVKAYSYRFVPYIVMTKPEVKATEALKLSMKMTRGKKGQMFLADFCFVAAIFVISLVLGLFSLIPILGILVGMVNIIFSILVVAFSNIFTGLYQASFYEESPAESEASAE